MKGLLKNNFYGVIENLKIALAFVMLVGVLLLITGEATLLSAFFSHSSTDNCTFDGFMCA